MKKSKNKWDEFWHLYGQGIACRTYRNIKTGEQTGENMFATDDMKRWYQEDPEEFVEEMEITRQEANKENGKCGLLYGVKSNDEGETIQ